MQKDVLWKAAFLTSVVFILGLSAGVYLDLSRVGESAQKLSDMELQWNDARLQSLFYADMANDSASCAAALAANLQFNERIYAEGTVIQKYEDVNRFAPQLLQEKRRYALLQLQFWLNSIELKKTCSADYSTVVYFYSHYDRSLENTQDVQSAVLAELKSKCGNSILLIPLPADLDLVSINLVKEKYGIKEMPSVLVDEKTVLGGPQGLSALERLMKC